MLFDESATTEFQPTDLNATLSLGLFDPSLGQLHNVHITVTGELIGGAEYENAAASASSKGSATYTINQTLDIFHDSQTMLAMADVTTKTVSIPKLPAFDGKLDYAGKSGRTAQGLDDKQFKVYDYAANSDLSSYIGKGTTTFTVKADAIAALSGNLPKGVSFGTYSLAEATVAIRYNYSPVQAPDNSGSGSGSNSGDDSGSLNDGGTLPTGEVAAVPEPNIGIMLGLGLLGVGVVRRYQKRSVTAS